MAEILKEPKTQNDYNDRFYIKNAVKIKEKILCECGGKFTYYNGDHHRKTMKHINYTKDKL